MGGRSTGTLFLPLPGALPPPAPVHNTIKMTNYFSTVLSTITTVNDTQWKYCLVRDEYDKVGCLYVQGPKQSVVVLSFSSWSVCTVFVLSDSSVVVCNLASVLFKNVFYWKRLILLLQQKKFAWKCLTLNVVLIFFKYLIPLTILQFLMNTCYGSPDVFLSLAVERRRTDGPTHPSPGAWLYSDSSHRDINQMCLHYLFPPGVWELPQLWFQASWASDIDITLWAMAVLTNSSWNTILISIVTKLKSCKPWSDDEVQTSVSVLLDEHIQHKLSGEAGRLRLHSHFQIVPWHIYKNEVRLLNDATGEARRTKGTGRGLLPADNPAQNSLQDPTQWVRDTLHGDTPTLEQNLKETEITVVLNN